MAATARKTVGKTKDGVRIEEPDFTARRPEIPKKTSVLGSSSYSLPKNRGMGLDEKRPAHERIEGEK